MSTDSLDAQRYRFLRDAQVYDSGMAVADFPTYVSALNVKLLQDIDLDKAVDREIALARERGRWK